MLTGMSKRAISMSRHNVGLILITALLMNLYECAAQFPDVQSYMTLGTLPPQAAYNVTPINPIGPTVSYTTVAPLGSAFSLLGCTQASNYSIPRSFSLQVNNSLASAKVTLQDGSVQQTGTPCTVGGICKFINFTLNDNEIVTNLTTCTKGIPGAIASSVQWSGFNMTTNFGRTIDGGACQLGTAFCFCKAQPVGSGILCGMYGYGAPPVGSVRTISSNGGNTDGGGGFLGEINVFSFAFLTMARTATLDSFTYPTIGQQLIQLQPQSGTAVYTATITNDSPVQQSQSRTVSLSKTLTSSWMSSSSLQNAVATKSSSSSSETKAYKVAASAKFSVGIPFLGKTETTISGEFDKSATSQTSSETDLSSQVTRGSGNSLEYQDTYTDQQSFPLIVPANSTLTWTAQLRSGQITLPYLAQLRMTFDDGSNIVVPIQGTYSGISASGTTVAFKSSPLTVPAASGG